MTPDQAVQAKAIELSKLALRATPSAGSGHPTTALSLAHLIAVLMYRRHPMGPGPAGCGRLVRLVLSEGHADPIIYAACADLGVTITPGGHSRAMTMDDLMALRSIGSPIDGHPNPILGFPFFDAATGSLGRFNECLRRASPLIANHETGPPEPNIDWYVRMDL